jgi:hypothetical protein
MLKCHSRLVNHHEKKSTFYLFVWQLCGDTRTNVDWKKIWGQRKQHTQVYPELNLKMAMKIGNQYDAHRIQSKQRKQFCETINYRYLALEKLIINLAETIKKAAEQKMKRNYLTMNK